MDESSNPARPAATIVLMREMGGAPELLMVVRADKTSEAAVRDAVGLLKGGAQVQLLLNAVRFTGGGRRFGSYYAKGEPRS